MVPCPKSDKQRALSLSVPLIRYHCATFHAWVSHVFSSDFQTSQMKVILRLTVSRPVCPGVRPQLGPFTNFYFSLKFSLDSFVILRRPLWREDGSVIYCCCLASPAHSLSGLSPAGLKTIFYCPNFLDSPPQPAGPGIYISQGHGDSVIPPDTELPFRHLLRLAGLLTRLNSVPDFSTKIVCSLSLPCLLHAYIILLACSSSWYLVRNTNCDSQDILFFFACFQKKKIPLNLLI
jgi:hypothetical protein